MFTQLLATAATAYGVLGAFKTLLQTRQMLARRSSREVSAGFLASYAGGYAIWLAYGLSTGSIPLIVVDTVGLLCGGLTLAVALSLRGRSSSHRLSPVRAGGQRPAAWSSATAATRRSRAAAAADSSGGADQRRAGRRADRGFGRRADLAGPGGRQRVRGR
jgi:uncharacterized protein with PQ loop repeat